MENTITAQKESGTDLEQFTIYSKYWRVNRSHHEATELALILRALRKVANHIGHHVKPIHWEGMVPSDNKSILLQPDEIRGIYPIPYQKMDILVGQVIRDAFGGIEWSEWVSNRLHEQAPAISKDRIDYLTSIFTAAEDIYINERTNSTTWSLYLNNYWKYLDHQNSRDTSLPPTPSSLANIWRKGILLGEEAGELHPYYEAPMIVLSVYTKAIKIAAKLPTIAERRNSRVEIYLRIWELLYQILSDWETFAPPGEGVDIRDELGPKKNIEDIEKLKEDETDSDEEEQPDTEGLEEELASQISSILEEGETDLTMDVAVAIEDPSAKNMGTVHTRGIAESTVTADPNQVKRLKKIFKKQRDLHKKARRKHIKRYLDQGKLDARRLYRVPVDGRAFNCKIFSRPDNAWNISIVSDASASMSGKYSVERPWDAAEKTFVSLVEAAKGFKNHLEVYGYHEDGDQCVLIELYQSGKLFTVAPRGRTPSGQAIMAAALVLNEKRKKSLIIHITDGAANCGINVIKSLEYCSKNRIDLITIGCGCNQQTRDFLQTRFPEGQLLLMDDIRDLSEGLERLFKKKLLKRITH